VVLLHTRGTQTRGHLGVVDFEAGKNLCSRQWRTQRGGRGRVPFSPPSRKGIFFRGGGRAWGNRGPFAGGWGRYFWFVRAVEGWFLVRGVFSGFGRVFHPPHREGQMWVGGIFRGVLPRRRSRKRGEGEKNPKSMHGKGGSPFWKRGSSGRGTMGAGRAPARQGLAQNGHGGSRPLQWGKTRCPFGGGWGNFGRRAKTVCYLCPAHLGGGGPRLVKKNFGFVANVRFVKNGGRFVVGQMVRTGPIVPLLGAGGDSAINQKKKKTDGRNFGGSWGGGPMPGPFLPDQAIFRGLAHLSPNLVSRRRGGAWARWWALPRFRVGTPAKRRKKETHGLCPFLFFGPFSQLGQKFHRGGGGVPEGNLDH